MLSDYSKSIRRLTATQTTTRKVEESFTAVETADVCKFAQTEYVRTAVRLIGDVSDGFRSLSKNEFVQVCDYLMVTTLFENTARPDPLENCLLDRFCRAMHVKDNDQYIVIVDEHKTTKHQGPAELVLNAQLYHMVKVYADVIQPEFAVKSEKHLFVKENGERFPHGTIGRRVAETFQHAGVCTERRVTATSILKLFSSAADKLSGDAKRVVASHMKHKTTTADRNYVLSLNARKATSAHIMKSIIQGATDSPKGSPTKASTSATKAVESDDEDDDVPFKDLKLKKQQSAVPDKSGEASTSKSTSKPASLTAEDCLVARSVFKKEIKRGEFLSEQEVLAQMRNDNHLKSLVVQPRKVKKVYDFVQYRTKLARTLKDVVDQPDDDGVKTLPDTGSVSSKSRRQWDADAVEVLENFFHPIKTMPLRREIMHLFETDNVLKHISATEGLERCYEKIKTLYKKCSQK